jgi:ATP-dependent DNA helicase RecG
MTVEELKTLIDEVTAQKCERQDVELKEAHIGTPKRLYDTLSAFANQRGGGTIVFGISEKQDYSVIGVYDPQDLMKRVEEQCKQMSPVIRPLFTVADIGGKTVVSAKITEADIFDKPCFYLGAGRVRGSYVRSGGADELMSEFDIYSYEAFKRKIQDELRTVDRADMTALDQDKLTEYFLTLKREKPNLQNLSREQLLKFQGIAEKDVPTVAGVMLFGIYPQGFYPQLSITAVVVPGYEISDLNAEERFVDNKRIEGTIPEMLEGAVNFIRRNMKVKTIIDEQTAQRRDKTEYPLKAIREIVLNSLVHRDYSVHTDGSPIRILMYKDRLVVENPGGLYGRLTIDDLGRERAADTRNPFIAAALEVMLKTENRFSGIPTIIAHMADAGLPPPVFESKRGVFRVTLYNGANAKAEVAPSINPTAATAGTMPDYEARILAFCQTPRSREEIAAEFGLQSTYYMVTRYLNPLIGQGKLKMTMPESPKSKNQRYVSV